jgi:hypothetical protein
MSRLGTRETNSNFWRTSRAVSISLSDNKTFCSFEHQTVANWAVERSDDTSKALVRPKNLLLWRGWILLEFRNRRIHLVPRLGFRNEDVHLWLKPARIIQTAGQDSDKRRIALFGFGSGHSRPALGTKTALVLSSSDAGGEVVMQLSARHSKRLCRHQHRGSEPASGCVLAISTMTFQHHDRLRIAFVTNCSAGTPSLER